MFYSQMILARKGPLGKIWMACHHDKKVTKNMVFSTDITDSVESVLNPAAPLALRVSGHLMLGIVRIYSRKVKYLMNDCTEAMWKIKLAFRPGNVDLSEDAQTAKATDIDDVRHYGKVDTDFEYPELAETAFNPDTLTTYSTLQAARGYDLASLSLSQSQDQFLDLSDAQRYQDRSRSPSVSSRGSGFVNIPPGQIPGEADLDYPYQGRQPSQSGSGSHEGRISDVEIARRGSISRSTLSGARASMSMAYINDEEIPAFDEGGGDDSMYFGGDTQVDAPALDDYDYQFKAPDLLRDSVGMDITGGDDYTEQYDGYQPYGDDEFQQAGDPTTLEDTTRSDKTKSVAKKGSKSTKRQRAIMDVQTELTTREMKAYQSDLSGILKRAPEDPLPSSNHREKMTIEERLVQPASIHGLCPELQNLFTMIMTNAPLPFPKKSKFDTSEVAEMVRGEDRSQSFGGVGGVDTSDIVGYDESKSPSHHYGYDDEAPSWTGRDKAGDDSYHHGDDQGPVYDDVYVGDDGGASMYADLEREGGEGASSPTNVFASSKDVSAAAHTTNASEMSTWNNRTARVFEILKEQFDERPMISFQEISKGVTRRTAAGSFLEILQLKTWGYIDLKQDKPFADLHIESTEKIQSVNT